MDLLSGLRKGDTSRGGRAEFSWDAVKEDKDRENYLGHSLMAPVGRWQRGKDLTWYAKGDSKERMTEDEQRKEEIKRIKQAEEDAIAAALGLPVPKREANANEEPLGDRAVTGDGKGKEGKSEGKKREGGRDGRAKDRSRHHRSRDRSRSRDRERRHRHRSRSRRRDRDHRHRDERDRDRDRHKRHNERRRGRSRSRSRSRSQSPRRHRDRDSRRS
jgi:hypothetical protein